MNVPAGVDSGQTLRMAGKGHSSEAGGPAGDLLIKVNVQSHPQFRREKYDVYTTAEIPISKAALGGVVEVDTLEGKTKLTIEPGDDLGVAKRLSGKGISYLLPNTSKRGDFYVIFKMTIPTRLTEKQRRLFEELAGEESHTVATESDSFFSKFMHKKK